ncbi:Imm1 family immunity protein [Streptomyces sp. NPDC086766]|uniref:Imm1 family immunity protein n=1 Tax=Streptomyces sp. NPDC086766 TaxID=3365754 RepID=UPI00382EE1F3
MKGRRRRTSACWVGDITTHVTELIYPRFHDPASAIPLDRVRAALEEFCLSGNGDRPSCIGWVSGEANGQRLDRAPVVDFVEDPVIDWGSLS